MSSGVRPSLFGGLGKATRRGIRKCPKCSTVNGTRGLCCKNKSCEYVFKEPNPDVKKLICPSLFPGHLYSVRHSSTSRAFIYMNGTESYCTECGNGPCKRLGSMPILSSEQEAVPFTLKVSVLNGMAIDDSLKHEIYSRAKEPGPLVQRVSRSWMVVKKSSTESSLFPFVHIRFGVKFYNCCCSDSNGKCFHFFASLAVFAGDGILSKEFSRFTSLLSEDEILAPSPIFSIQDQNGEMLQVSVVDDDLQKEFDFLTSLRDEPPPIAGTTTFSVEEANELLPIALSSTEDELMSSSSTVIPSFLPPTSDYSMNNSISPSRRKLSESKRDVIVQYSFLDWLASVTEKINQTMHYQFDGQPAPLIFHAPQAFFHPLHDRIYSITKKTVNTITFVRQDALPLGTFTKYSWSLSNIFHVKEIFDTHRVPLDISRTFVQKEDGTFNYVPPDAYPNKRSLLISNNNSIRSPELKTYLKVGQMSNSSKDFVPFVIEWTPDILPIMKVGELKIIFEYGHNRNGSLDNMHPPR